MFKTQQKKCLNDGQIWANKTKYIFVYVKNIPDGFSDNWKEAKFNKIDACQTGFFPLTETIFL